MKRRKGHRLPIIEHDTLSPKSLFGTAVHDATLGLAVTEWVFEQSFDCVALLLTVSLKEVPYQSFV